MEGEAFLWSYAYNYSTLFSQKEQKILPATDGYGKFVITLDDLKGTRSPHLLPEEEFVFYDLFNHASSIPIFFIRSPKLLLYCALFEVTVTSSSRNAYINVASSSGEAISITSVKCPSVLFLNPAIFSPVQIEHLMTAY